MSPIRIVISKDPDGFVFRLNSVTRAEIQANQGVGTLPEKLFIAYETEQDFRSIHGPFYRQAAYMLTGLSEAALRNVGGVGFVDAITEESLHTERFGLGHG